MFEYQQSTKRRYPTQKPKPSLHALDNDEEEDNSDQEYYKFQAKKKRRLRAMTQSSSPEPQPSSKKGRKKAFLNPNRKDKAGRTKLFFATTAGHLDKVKELIELGADVNFKDNAGWTPLHEAALKGQYEIGRHLIKCGAEINVRGFGLDTPLHDACSSNSPECVQLLVDAGADVFALNEAEKRPIDLCTDEACQRILQTKMNELERLIARDKDGRSSLHRACVNNRLQKAQSLIEQGADVNAKDNQDATPLHLACAAGHLDVVKLLIDQGGIVNILGTDRDDTPLHQASRNGHVETVKYLISSAGADVNMKDKSGKNPYQVSTAYPLIRQLLTARMDEVRLEREACNALDEIASKTAQRNEPERQLTREEKKIQNYMRVFANLDGKPPQSSQQLMQQHDFVSSTASKKKKRTTRRKSVSVESDVSLPQQRKKSPSAPTKLDATKKDTSGRTQLHKYAKRGDTEKVETLLEIGANPDEKDYAGWTPLHEAALNGHYQVVKALLRYGASANPKGADMDTPLHDATENNHCDIVELLLEHGADPFARNAHDAEPIDIATENEFDDIVLVLQSASPVAKKKRVSKIKREGKGDKNGNQENENGEDEDKNSSSIDSQTERFPKKSTKKRRLIQAADLIKNKLTDDDEQLPTDEACSDSQLVAVKLESDVEDVVPSIKRKKSHKNNSDDSKHDMEKGELQKQSTTRSSPNAVQQRYIPCKKSIYNSMVPPLHSPIHTPPPDHWNVTNKDFYSPLYTVQMFNAPNSDYYVIDLQVSLLLGIPLDKFWLTYPYLNRKIIHTEGKARLWCTLKQIIHEEKEQFVSRTLYFIALDDVLHLIKRDFNHLSANLITITLDIGYSDESVLVRKHYNLPPKIAMKMKKCGYQFQH
ncbi:ankyrin repeat-containing domain protein [Blakeslea trispora]|nr:ankyrin repeat-containing domain protein [Blakeslea trispora]